MRIIAGKYRGRKLKSPPSLQTRPTSDRLRETLFNILAPRIKGARFLDLCAGSGAVGIESLSRGASQVTFVDQSRETCALIEENLAALRVDEISFEIITAEATAFLRKHAKAIETAHQLGWPFDVIFFDPPYVADYEPALELIGSENRIIGEGSLVIVEHYKKRELSEEFGRLSRFRELKQGDSVLSFYETG